MQLIVRGANNNHSNGEAIVSSEKKLNVHSGPGLDFRIIGQLQPGEHVSVTDISHASNSWIEIHSQNGIKGYVLNSYLSGDYMRERGNRSIKIRNIKELIRSSPVSQLHRAVYFYLLRMGSYFAILLPLFVCLIELFFIFWLKLKYGRAVSYSFRGSPSPRVAYIVLIVSAILTLPTVPLYSYAIENGAWATILYLLMLLSTGCLMIHAAWRIKLCGMVDGKCKYESNLTSYHVGLWTGDILWFILLIPIAKIWWNICDVSSFYVYKTGDHFAAMLITIVCIAILNLFILKLLWMRVIVKYLFQIASQWLIYVMSFIFLVGISYYEYDMLNYNFYMLNYVVSLCLFIPIVFFALIIFWSSITEHRCARCHSFRTREIGSTDLGYEQHVSSEWKSMGEGGVNQRIRGSEITNARKLVRTTEIFKRWKTHHQCMNCFNEWDIDHKSKVNEHSETLEKRWDENY